MQPTTYYVQNDTIDALVNRYGSQLQELSVSNKLAMLAILARVLYMNRPEMEDYGDTRWTVEDDIADSAVYDETIDNELFQHLVKIGQLDNVSIMRLCEALTSQLSSHLLSEARMEKNT